MTLLSITHPARSLAVALAALLAGASGATAAEISPELVAKAKKEGQLTYYTDLIVNQIVRPLTSAFEAKYGIKVEYVRGDSQVNSLKLLNEKKAGRMMADVFGLTSGLPVLIKAGVARRFRQPMPWSCRRNIAMPTVIGSPPICSC